MSYRNPQQYGIVEDMTAGTRAFQQSFGQVQGIIEKRKKEREEGKIREAVNEDKYLEGVKEATKNAEGLEIGSTNAVEEFAELYISDGFFKDKSVAERRKALNNIEKSAGLGGALETTLTEFQTGAIDFENPATEKWLQETKNLGEKAFYVDKKTKQLMVNGMTWSAATSMLNEGKITVQGDANTDTATRQALQKGADKVIKSETEKLGRNLTDEEKRDVVKKYVSSQNDILGNPDQHYVWKNKISNNNSFFSAENTLSAADQRYALKNKISTNTAFNIKGTSYNGSELSDEQRNIFLEKRQDKLADYYTNIITGVEPDQRLMTRYQEDQLKINKRKAKALEAANKIKIDENLSEEQNLKNLRQGILNTTSGYVEGGNKEKTNEQLTADLSGIPVDGLPGISGTGTFIRKVQRMPTQGADGKFEVKIEFGKFSGTTDLRIGNEPDQTFIIDLNDKEIQRKLGLNKSLLAEFGDFRKDLSSTFLKKGKPENNDFSQPK